MLMGHSRDLVRGTIGMMVDWLVAECRQQCGQWVYGIDWFDQWEASQRIWLLEVIAKSFLTTLPPPPRWAIFEATTEAIVCELKGLVQMEINDHDLSRPGLSWRDQVLAATAVEMPANDARRESMFYWNRQIARWIDPIVGPLSYVDAERFRDADPAACATYLVQRGLPDDFLSAVPPMRTIDQTQLSIDRIQNLIFEN